MVISNEVVSFVSTRIFPIKYLKFLANGVLIRESSNLDDITDRLTKFQNPKSKNFARSSGVFTPSPKPYFHEITK